MYFAATPAPPATSAPCATGSWAHKFACGWHQPTTAAANAGHSSGHWILLAVIVLLVLLAAAKISKGRAGTPVPSK